MSPDTTAPLVSASPTLLQRLRWPLMVLGPILVIAAGVYFYVTGGRYESTDDAYTQAATVSISASVAGRVVAIGVHDNQRVRRGEVLFRLDDAPFRIAVSAAEARLGAARLQVMSLKSTYRQRLVDMRAADNTLAYRKREEDRALRLLKAGIASQAQADAASHALDAARQDAASVQQQIAVALANLGGDPDLPIERHPDVLQALAALDRARLDLSYTVIAAPSDGVATKVEQLQVGDYIAASAPVFALVSTQDVWIEANFKEVQLAHMQPGEKAAVRIDRFPDKRFTAIVGSLSPSTGSQFSLLPPENATGNWVNVVQRVPVRLRLTDGGGSLPLQGGLSASVTVDTQSRSEQAPVAEEHERVARSTLD